MKIGVIVAMDKEFIQLKALLDNVAIERHHNIDFVRGIIQDKEIILQKCGIGKVNSSIGTQEMIINYSPDLIVSTGVAGGALKEMMITDVVVGTQYCYHDAYCGSDCQKGQIMGMPPKFSAPKELVNIALSSGEKNVHSGLIVSGEWFVDSKEKMLSILEDFPSAIAVDMESCSIAQTCYIYGVPFISFRIISDLPLTDTNGSQYFDFWSKIALGSFSATRNFLLRINSSNDNAR